MNDSTRVSDSTPPADWYAPGPDAPAGYEILGTLGRGGMGVVYQARQLRLRRIVALKMILDSGSSDAEQVHRFLREAEIIARLQHPNIVQIHELGEHQGRPFFALEFCAGGSLASQLDGQPWTPERAAEVIQILALATHYAHTQGVVHRDLKPANVLLAVPTSGQGITGDTTVQDQPITLIPVTGSLVNSLKITDFGIAKQTMLDQGMTATGAIVGTPSYMAPEQALGQQQAISPATDVYSLGAMLYELVTGRPPFVAASAIETVWQVAHQDPVPPSRLLGHFPRDMETIILKCLAKDAAGRYRSAQELADDLGRFQRGEPIHARPISGIARAWRWARRNPLVASLMVAVVTVSLIGSIVSSRLALIARSQASLAEEERSVAERRLDETHWLLYSAHVARAHRDWEAGQVDSASDSLDLARWDFRNWEHRYLYTTIHAQQAVLRTRMPLDTIRLSDDESTLSARNSQGEWSAWSTHNGERLTTPAIPLVQRNASQSRDGRFQVVQDGTALLIQDRISQRDELRLDAGADSADVLAISADGEHVAAAFGREIRVWNGQTSRLRYTVADHTDNITALDFTPDGQYLISTSHDGTLRIWDSFTGRSHHTYYGHEGPITGLVAFADCRRVATCSLDATVRIWDIRRPQALTNLFDARAEVISLSVHPHDGETVMVSTADPGATIYSMRTGQPQQRLLDYDGPVWYSPNGQTVAGRVGKRLRVQRLDGSTPLIEWELPSDRLPLLRFSPDGTLIALAFDDGTMILKPWDRDTGIIRWKAHDEMITGLAFHPSQPRVFTSSLDNKVKGWDTATGTQAVTFDDQPEDVLALAIGPDGTYIATGGADNVIKIWNTETGKLASTLRGHRKPVSTLAISEDGQRLVSGSSSGIIKVWEPRTGTELLSLRVAPSDVKQLVLDPLGHYLLIGLKNGRVERLDGSLENERYSLSGHAHLITAMALSPDQKHLLSGGEVGRLKYWDLRSGQELLSLRPADAPIVAVGISPDGQRLIARDNQGRQMVWDAVTGKELPNITEPAPVARQSLRIEEGNFQIAIEDNVIVYKHRDASGDDCAWSTERIKSWSRVDLSWHREQLNLAESRFDWSAARYHLQWLLKESPRQVRLRLHMALLQSLDAHWDAAAVDLLRAWYGYQQTP